MYDMNGLFCCETGLVGYGVPMSNSDGCGDPGVSVSGGVQLLAVVSQSKKESPRYFLIECPPGLSLI